MLKFLKYLLQLLISPANGWDDISHAGTEPSRLTAEGFYPLLGASAITAFIPMIYDHEISLAAALQNAIIIFVQYFISLFLANYIFATILPRYIDGEPNEKRTSTFIIYNLSLLALITIIENILPFDLAIVQFLPIVVAVVMWRGCRYMAVLSDRTGRFMIAAIVTIIAMPLLLGYLLHLLAPAA